MSKQVKYELKEPIELGSEIISELTITEPKVKQLKLADSLKGIGDISKGAKYIEICCNIPPVQVDELSAKDYVNISEIIADFLS